MRFEGLVMWLSGSLASVDNATDKKCHLWRVMSAVGSFWSL